MPYNLGYMADYRYCSVGQHTLPTQFVRYLKSARSVTLLHPATRLLPHESGELRRRQCRRVDVAEGSLVLQLARGGDEPAHRGAIKRAGEADTTHASRFQLRNGKRHALNTGHEIERLGNRGAHRL